MAVITTITMILATMASGKTIYVDDDAAGNDNGSSWENAYVYLQDALVDANDSEKPVEIRVARGTYTPDINNINIAFELVNGITIAGGYAGAADPNARDIDLYETILTGDLNSDDVPLAEPYDLFEDANNGSRYDNSYNVVVANNTDETAVLDGFTITGGIASKYSDNDIPQKHGGGLYCFQSAPVISNCTFTFNAAHRGGAMYCKNSSPTLINCRFDNNAALSEENESGYTGAYGGYGGAIHNLYSSPILTNCAFTGNCGNYGGAINNAYGNPILIGCKFIQNTAKSEGGGLKNHKSSPILTGCMFEGNSADAGGGMHNLWNAPILTGCTFVDNYAGLEGGGINNKNSEPNMTDCTFISNNATNGGALFNTSCKDMVITNCTFSGNSALQSGGMENYYGEMIAITNSLFTGNASQNGRVINNYNCDLTLTNCTIVQNATREYNSYIPGNGNIPDGYFPPEDNLPNFNFDPSRLELVNCIIRDEAISILDDDNSIINVSYSNIQGDFNGEGNIDIDPLFVNPGHWADINDPNIVTEANDPNAVWINGDYHLKSQAGRWDPADGSWVFDDVTSPCIDAGDPDSPIGDEPVPNGGRINMGAYGGASKASKSNNQPAIMK